MSEIMRNVSSLARIGLCWLAGKGVDVAGWEDVISAALLLGAAVWAMCKNRKAVKEEAK